MRSSVVIVNWNAGPALLDCLASVPAGGAGVLETIVVDNASSDGSLAAARERHPGVRVVETGANLGFAAGANRGAAVARGDALVFLNPDARVEAGAIDGLVAALAATPGAGIAGGGLVGADGRWQPGSARFHPIAHLLLDTTPGRLERSVTLEQPDYRVTVPGTWLERINASSVFDAVYSVPDDEILNVAVVDFADAALSDPAVRDQHLALTGQVDRDDGQNRHLAAMAIIDHAEVGAVGEQIAVVCL